MKIQNKYIDKNNLENITLLTRNCISAIRQLRAGEPVFMSHGACIGFDSGKRV